MALFEFEDGRLVPAQFGYPVAQDLGPELVDAICQQVLQIVSRPLFPVTWRDMTGQGEEETPRLTALDVTGQIVSVEILKELDSDTLITSLSRLAEVASISWADLANEYPSGPEGFRTGWAQFRDSMPPAVGPGPRLIMVAGEIDPSVRPALSLLATSGVEVHLMNLRQMSNGRLFLDVNAVGPRLYGHAPQVLASAAAAPELTSGPSFGEVEQESLPSQAPGDRQAQDEEPDNEEPDNEEPGSEEPGCEEPDARDECDAESDGETPTTRPTPKVAPHLRDVFSYPASEEPPAPWQPSEAEGASDADPTDEAAQGRGGEADAGDDAHADGAQDADAAEQQETSEDPDEGAEDDESPADLQEDRDPGEAETNEADEADADDDEGPAESSVTLDPRDDDRAARARGEGELPGGDDEEDSDAACEQPEEDTTEDAAEEAPSERPAHLGSRASRRAQIGELNDAGATYAATDSFVDHAEESAEVIQAREEGVPVLSRDESGLRALAQILGEDTPLVARSELGLPADLMLEANGAIFGAGLTYPSLDTLLTARGLGHIQAWALVRIGDRLGPTLAEALDEINREIVREYSDSPRGRRSARH
ncbi:hypothetical protein [Kytococcus sedentarius]|uniref:hypothetical protein n=1 Tax=Kytococcus sedentarius TaxID=1276 RepID=UPI000660BDCC|nr:hypothetical protein [Kytococcus sedentarius]